MKYLVILFSAVLFIFACGSGESQQSANNSDAPQIEVKEVLQTTNYTYLIGTQNGKEIQIAVPSMQAQIGDTYYYKGGMEMSNFESKELKRTFDKIVFAEAASKEPIIGQTNSNPHGSMNENPHGENQNLSQGSPTAGKKEISKIEPVSVTITIAELFANKDKYKGKTVKIKGQVVKFTEAVMDKNWIHIQDGTEHNGDFDLTVTTLQTVKIDDVIIVEGKITLDKDFGYGYKYKILLEDSKIK